MIAASDRLTQVSQQAGLLIEEQKKKQAQKTEPKQPSALSRAIREALQKHDRRGMVVTNAMMFDQIERVNLQ